ncbi:MAG TPA: hypothetical protein VIV35_02320, partial [Chitinophagaceae bacterium]
MIRTTSYCDYWHHQAEFALFIFYTQEMFAIIGTTTPQMCELYNIYPVLCNNYRNQGTQLYKIFIN